MGTASLIIGIISLCIALVPLFGSVAFTPAIAGLVFGIIHVTEKSDKKEKKGKGVAGIVLCSIAIVVIVMYYVLIVVFAVTVDFSEIGMLKNTSKNIEMTVGDTVEYDGLEIKYISLDDDYTDYVEQRKLKEGYKLIKLVLEIKNKENTSEYIGYSDFKCYADDYVCDSIFFETESGIDAFLSKDKRVQGNLFYEVPTDAKEITIEYETYGFWPIANKLILKAD